MCLTFINRIGKLSTFIFLLSTFFATFAPMKRLHLILYVAILLTISLSASAEEKNSSFPVKAWSWLKNYMYDSTVKGINQDYIEVPKKEWTAELTTTINHSPLKLETEWNYDKINGTFTSHSDNGLTTAVGVAIAYRSYGVGFSKIVNGTGSNFSIGFSGSNYAINASIKSYESDSPEIKFDGTAWGEEFHTREKSKIDDPIKVRTFFIDGYYFFNGSKFSYLSAYSPSLIQRRSAGSLFVGAMYSHSRVNFGADNNADMIIAMQGIERVKSNQWSVGAGYAYNWVPAKNLTVNCTFMPTLTLYNRNTVYRYDIKDIINYGFNHIDDEEYWSYDDEGDEESPGEILQKYPLHKDKTPNRVCLNFDARVSVIYHWTNIFVRAYGQFNRFSFGGEDVKGRLIDWTIYTSVGTRF